MKRMMTINFLGQCGIKITSETISIAIDPVLTKLIDHGVDIRLYPSPILPEELEVDYIFCTHDHIDHMAKETVCRVAEANFLTKFIIPAGCKKEMLSWGIDESRIVTMKDGESINLKDGALKVQGLSTAHPTHHVDEEGLDHNIAYALSFDDKCIVHLGDTYYTDRLHEGLKKLGKIDLLFPPINGMDEEKAKIGLIGNLSCEEAARLACEVAAKVVIPTHFDMVGGNTEDPQKLVDELAKCNAKCECIVPKLMNDIVF